MAQTRLDPEALRALGGDDFVRELLVAFREEAERRLAVLGSGGDTPDYPTAMRAAHALKSSAAHIGAPRVSEAARNLEAAAREANAETFPTCLAALRAAYEEIEGALSPSLDGGSGGSSGD